MSSQIQRRRGTTVDHSTFTGAQGEFTYDTQTKAIVTHDGVTPGGFPGGGFLQAGSGAVVRTAQSKMRDVVSVKDFGAVGDGVADDTAAIQLAVNHCLANHLDLEIVGLCRVTSSINIDRQVDGAAFDSYFTIFTNSSGGFYVDSGINIFSSSLVDANSPVSQLVRWQNLRFVASSSSLSAYVINGVKFLRCEFNGCSFSKIRALVSSIYTQSLYFYNCNARRWQGSFFQCLHGNYDIQVIGGLYEAGGTCFDMVYPRGSKFYTQIEGMSGTALKLHGCSGVDISCYLEENGTDFDCRNDNYPNKGVFIHSCFVVRPSGDAFVWGTGSGLVSVGNYGTSATAFTLHNLQASSYVEINDVVDAPVILSNADAATNVGYREGVINSLSVRTSGSTSYTVSNLSANYTKNGKHVTCFFKLTLTSNATHGGADSLYITSGFPYIAEASSELCGTVEVVGVGSSVMSLLALNPPRPISSSNIIPANVSGDSWTVRGQISYMATV